MWFWGAVEKPGDFDAFVRPARAAIVAVLRSGRNPTNDDFEPTWAKLSETYKPLFVAAQKRRCAWCDRTLTDYGALDHVRPKSELSLLDPARPGREALGGVNRAKRSERSKLRCETPGYWWLAFRWSNFVLSCTQCNTGWKRSFVARRGDSATSFSSACPSRRASEGWLVLHPYSRDRAGAHFLYNDDGSVESRTEQGRGTIDVVGLDRDSLRACRMPVVNDALRCARRFSLCIERWTEHGDVWALEGAVEALSDVLEKGDASRSLASVVRAVTERELDESWEGLRALLDELRADA